MAKPYMYVKNVAIVFLNGLANAQVVVSGIL